MLREEPIYDASPDAVGETLGDLMDLSAEAVATYRAAAELVDDPELADLLAERADRYGHIGRELRGEIAALGFDPDVSGGMSAGFEQGWIAPEELQDLDDEGQIVAACVRGEDATVAAFEAAIEETTASEVRGVIERYYEEILEWRDEIRGLGLVGAA